MATDQSRTAPEIPDAIFAAIGRVAVFTARLDGLLQDLLASFAESNPTWLLAITQGQSAKAISDTLRVIAKLRLDGDDPALEELSNLLEDIDTLRSERNRVVHGQWTTDAPTGTVFLTTIRLDRAEMAVREVLTLPDLAELIKEALRLFAELLGLARRERWLETPDR